MAPCYGLVHRAWRAEASQIITPMRDKLSSTLRLTPEGQNTTQKDQEHQVAHKVVYKEHVSEDFGKLQQPQQTSGKQHKLTFQEN